MSVVIHTQKEGIYLGSCMGLGFWSKLDSCGQLGVVTFHNEFAAKEYVKSWDNIPEGIEFTEVYPDDVQYASIAACVHTGLSGCFSQ